MLNQLIESKELKAEAARRGKFLFSTMMAAMIFCLSGLVWSLFAKELGVTDENFELSRLAAPLVEAAEEEPPIPEAIQKTPEIRQSAARNQTFVSIRKINMASTSESQFVPKDVSSAPVSQLSRPKGAFIIGKIDSEAAIGNHQAVNRGGNATGNSISSDSGIKAVPIQNKLEAEDAPPILKKGAPPKSVNSISLGVLNGKAVSLPKPSYTAAAQAVRARGDVNVEVVIDETGKVVSARAVSGHPLLKSVCETAARGARFSPTLLSKVPVKVTGVIVYKFSIN